MILKKLAEYNLWAGDKIREILNGISNDKYQLELDKPFTKNLNTLQKLLEHVILGEEFAVILLNNRPYQGFEESVPNMVELTIEQSIERWKKVDQEFLTVIQKDISGMTEFPISTKEGIPISKEDLTIQFLNHSLYHRGQIMLALNMLDEKTVGTDYITHLFEKL